MKRLLVFILLTCLAVFPALTGGSYARGEIDLSPYAVPVPQTTAAYGGARLTVVTVQRGEAYESSLCYEVDGQQVSTVPLPGESSEGEPLGHTPFATQEGRLGLFSYTGRNSLFRLQWWENGQLIPCLEEKDISRPKVLRTCAMAVRKAEPQLACWNLDGTLRFTLPLDTGNTTLYDAAETQDGSLLLAIQAADGPSDRDWEVLRLSAQGAVLLRAAVSDLEGFSNDNQRFLAPDGQGGFYFFAAPSADYKQNILQHLDAQGKRIFSKALRAENAIVDINLAENDGQGNMILYGTVFADSRGLFRAFALTVDAQGNILARDFRDFTTPCGYNYYLLATADGEKAVLAYDADASPGMVWYQVPFDALPCAEDPGVTLE